VTAFDPPVALAAGTPTEGVNKFFIPLTTTVDPGSFDVESCTTTTGSNTVTAAAGSFDGVKVGNAVSGTGIPVACTVAAVSEDGSTLTLSDAATADGTVTLTFDPDPLTATVYGVELAITQTGYNVYIQAVGHVYDGSLGDTPGTPSNSTSSATLGGRQAIDMDGFYTKIQIPRS